MQTIDAAEIHRLLDYPSLVEALREMFRAGCTAPLRQHLTVPGAAAQTGTLLLMPAWRAGRHIGVKIVTVFPDNAARALPSVHGSYLLLDGATGVPIAVLDGTALTLRRTAAASALASSYLAREGSTVHLMVGAGALAPHLVAAHAAMRPVREVRVWARDPARAAGLVEQLRQQELPAVAMSDLRAAAADADIITCATLAREPLIRGEWLKPGTHLDLVGGYTPEMREADDEAVRRASVYIDTDGALSEAGDIVQPLRSGLLTRETIAGDLFGLVRGATPGRRDDQQITLFKSVGTALEDLAAAELVANRRGLT